MRVTRAMGEQMRAGSGVVDLAADSGGNVEGVVAGFLVALLVCVVTLVAK